MSNKKSKIIGLATRTLGEVGVVVVGILLAVWINNLNADLSKNDQIVQYTNWIDREVANHIKLVDNSTTFTRDSIITTLVAVRSLVVEKDTTQLDLLEQGVAFLAENDRLDFKLPLLEEFVDKGFLAHINSEELNRQFWFYNYTQSQCVLINEQLNDYQINLLKPFLIRKIRYSNYDSYSYAYRTNLDRRQELIGLLGDLEFENLLSLLISHYENFVWRYGQFSKALENINSELGKIRE